MTNPLELPKMPTVQPLLFDETELPIPVETSKTAEVSQEPTPVPEAQVYTLEQIEQMPNAELVSLAATLPKEVLHTVLNKLVGQRIANGTEKETQLRRDIVDYERIRGELYLANMQEERTEQGRLQSRK